MARLPVSERRLRSARWSGSRSPNIIRWPPFRFATSIALVIGAANSEAAQPRALIGGHVVSTLIGLAILKLAGPHAWAAAIAVGLAILAMDLTGTFHPPAGIDPLLVVSNNLGWSYLAVPVLAGALLLTLFAYVWHRWLRRQPWPQRWI